MSNQKERPSTSRVLFDQLTNLLKMALTTNLFFDISVSYKYDNSMHFGISKYDIDLIRNFSIFVDFV